MHLLAVKTSLYMFKNDICNIGYIFLLLYRGLSEEGIILLFMGLKFLPVPSDIDGAKLRQGMEEFKRRVRLRWFVWIMKRMT